MNDEVELDTQIEEVEQAAPEEKTMDDTIRETLEAIEARDHVEEEKTDRLRDENGRFAKQEEVAQLEEVTEQPVDDAQQVTIPPELQRLGLRKEEAEAIAANPTALQAFMRRSEEMHKGLEQYRDKAQFGEQMAEAVRPFMDTINGLNVTPAQAVQKLMGADQALRYGNQQQKQAMMAQIARDYGVDMGFLQNPETANQYYVDPQVSALQNRLNQMQGWIEQQNQAREWQERQALNSEIERFSSDPGNKHFEAVRETMAGLLQAGLASDLKDAYEKAIYANPNVRSTVLAEQHAAEESKRKAEAAQKAQEAKRAAAVNVTKRGVVRSASPVGSMEDTIRSEAERLGIL